MKSIAYALAALLAFAILAVWTPARWPIAILQCGAFVLCGAANLGCSRLSAGIFTLPQPRSKLLIPLTAIVLWILLQLVLHLTIYPHETIDALLIWITNLAVFFVAYEFSADPWLARRFLRAAAAFGAALAALAMLQLFTTPSRIFWIFPIQTSVLPAGPFLSRNQYAALIELLLPIAIVSAIEDRAHRATGLVMAAIMYASVIAVASRAGALLTTAIILLLLAQARYRRQVSSLAIVAAAAILLLFTAAAGWGTLAQRWNEPAGYRIRSNLLRSSLAMVAAHPLTGCGLGTWSTAYPAYARYDDGTFVNQAHNDWAQWTAEGGIPMLLFMLWIAAGVIRPTLRQLWPIGLAAVLLHSWIDYPMQKPVLEAVFFALLGLACATTRLCKNPLTL